jgi:hypothetical protein
MRHTTVECTNCYTSYNHVEVFGGEAVIPTVRCFFPECPVDLCPSCEQFACDGCGHAMCHEHQINFQGLRLCTACLQEALEANEPECECVPSGAPDLFDARSCDFHNASSDYKMLLGRITECQGGAELAASMQVSPEVQPNF